MAKTDIMNSKFDLRLDLLLNIIKDMKLCISRLTVTLGDRTRESGD